MTSIPSLRSAWRFSLCGMLALQASCSLPSGREADGDTLVVLLPRAVQEIDPRLTGDAYGHKLSRLLFASLVRIDARTLAVLPDLAAEVAIETPSRYRVRLRPGLHFSDGSVLDAEDVVATYRSVVDPRLGSRYTSTYQHIARIEVLDPLNLVFELTGAHAPFMTDLELPIVRAEDALRPLGRIGGPAPIGSGPYVLRERDAGRIELSANRYWHAGKPRYPRVRMLVIHDDNTRALRLLAGKGDLALNAIPPLLLPLFEHDPRFVVRNAAGFATTYLGVNLDAPTLHDVRVRRALAHAIDRAALIRAKFGGRARLADGWVVPGHWAYDTTLPRYAYDPKRARELLQAAGAIHDGKPLRLSLRCGNDRFRQSIARAIAAMLERVGVEVELQPTEVATLIANLNGGRFELTMLELPELVEPHVLDFFFASTRVPGAGNEGSNRWRFRDPALDAALERGRSEIDLAERYRAYADVQRILAEQLPAIPLWHEDVVAIEGVRARSFWVPRLARFDPLARRD